MKPSARKPVASGSLRNAAPVPEEHLGYLLKRLQHSVRQSVDEALREAEVGLSFAHIAALFGIHHHPGISGAQIAKRAMVTAQTINTILHRLEKEGSVERRTHPGNRRVDCWYITASGLARMREAQALAEPVWARMLAPLTDAEIAEFRSLVKRCIAGLESGRSPDGPAARSRTAKQSVQKKESSTRSQKKG